MSHRVEELVTSSGLHAELQIPKKYLQQLLTDLSKKGLVTSIQGKYGGYKLAKLPMDIYVFDVLAAVEGTNETLTCVFGFGDCARKEPCPVHDSWQQAQSNIDKILKSTRLSDLSEK